MIYSYVCHMLKHVPNTITILNLCCGLLGIIAVFQGDIFYTPALMIALAATFDFFDGFAARMLKAYSAIGKDLDSLADLVSFGVLPGMIMYKLIELHCSLPSGDILHENHKAEYPYLKFIGLIIPVFSALRLAKFNNDLRQTTSFIGLPTPANAIFIGSVSLLYGMAGNSWWINPLMPTGRAMWTPSNAEHDSFTFNDLMQGMNEWTLVIITVVFSLLLLAELPLFSLKFKSATWKDNEVRWIFLAICIIGIITFKIIAIPFIIILYVLLSVINNMVKGRKKKDYDVIANK